MTALDDIGPILPFRHGEDEAIAEIKAEAVSGELITGHIHWLGGEDVRGALRELEALILGHMLPLVDVAQERIDALGLTISWRGRSAPVQDLQVFEEETVSVRCDPDFVAAIAEARPDDA